MRTIRSHRTQSIPLNRLRGILLLALLLISACSATAVQVIPTELPTETATFTASPSNTPGRNATPTRRPTQVAAATGGPSPTSLLGPTRTAPALSPTATSRPRNPNAPRIEFFTSDVLAIEPGGEITLFWSARGVDNAVIYRLNREGERTQVWNVPSDSSLEIQTRSSERGQLEFVLTIGEDETYDETRLIIPIQCPIQWFFVPPPDECADEESVETLFSEQPFERGRMLYVESNDLVYVLFNDSREPAWLAFENRYDPEVHPESEEGFVPPPGFFQPLRELGHLWRSNDTVRNRLGLATLETNTYQGFLQTSTISGDRENLYLTSADNTVLHIIPGGDVWQIISP